LKILIQRAVVKGLAAEGFCRRPDKPWDGIDYFARDSDANIDLMRILGGWGKSTPSLHEIASLSGIPGKLKFNGSDVASLWLQGEHQRIVDYNECDAVTTYLLWLRIAHFAGKFDDVEYRSEQNRVRDLLVRESLENGKEHLAQYLEEWERLGGLLPRLRPGIGAHYAVGATA
jgi:predicted PolB exonuclease-like 3'-5' exonuclease